MKFSTNRSNYRTPLNSLLQSIVDLIEPLDPVERILFGGNTITILLYATKKVLSIADKLGTPIIVQHEDWYLSGAYQIKTSSGWEGLYDNEFNQLIRMCIERMEVYLVKKDFNRLSLN